MEHHLVEVVDGGTGKICQRPSPVCSGQDCRDGAWRIFLYGTVLPWSTDPRTKGSSSYEVFAEALEAQKSDWLKIQRDFPKAALIVAGDFNQGLVDYHYYGSTKKQRLLESALKESHLLSLVSGVDDHIARDSFLRANIDHICIISAFDWSVEEARRWPDAPVPGKSLSDHFGVKVKVNLAT